MQEDKKTSKGKVNPCWILRCPQETREDTRRASWKAWFDQVGHKGWRGCFWHIRMEEKGTPGGGKNMVKGIRLLAVMWYNAQICHWGALVWFQTSAKYFQLLTWEMCPRYLDMALAKTQGYPLTAIFSLGHTPFPHATSFSLWEDLTLQA